MDVFKIVNSCNIVGSCSIAMLQCCYDTCGSVAMVQWCNDIVLLVDSVLLRCRVVMIQCCNDIVLLL